MRPRLAVLAMTVLVVACAAAPRAVSPRMSAPWLSSFGFAERADWPSAALHVGPDDFGDAGGVFDLIEDLPALELRRPEGEGWGVYHSAGAEGAGCELSVWVNGNRMARLRERSPMTIDALVQIKALDGLEVHLGAEGPVREEPVCGALLLWSERNADPSDLPFVGRVLGRITGADADTVTSVVLSPGGASARMVSEGRFEFEPVLPGIYQVAFRSGGETIYLRSARVFARRDSYIEVELEAR